MFFYSSVNFAERQKIWGPFFHSRGCFFHALIFGGFFSRRKIFGEIFSATGGSFFRWFFFDLISVGLFSVGLFSGELSSGGLFSVDLLSYNRGRSPPNVSTPFFLVRAAAAAAKPKSCFDEAENRAASSLGVGGHRYTRVSCVSKLLWV